MQGVHPSRPGGPTSVGSYEVTGFLGEGDHGSVYLGVSPAVLVPPAWTSTLLLRGRNATNVHVSPVHGDYDLLTMGVR
ncbi:hypothetical protein [Nonomuraea sp. NPDC050786]|uniref:hypothetical protein n=1 Tax=Nonomuraea sp. NPDC050786 TaxID=3154840 RepID=UPI0033C7D34E